MQTCNKQIISKICHQTRFVALFVALFVAGIHPSMGQQARRQALELKESSWKNIIFSFDISDYELIQKGDSLFMIKWESANSSEKETGKPLLPQYHKIIDIPKGSRPIAVTEDEEWETVILAGEWKNLTLPTAPPPSWKEPPSTYNATDTVVSMTPTPLVKIKPLGEMRGRTLVDITITPFRHNEKEHTIEVCKRCTMKIEYGDGVSAKRTGDGAGINFAKSTKDYSNLLADDNQPKVYMIVSPEKYRNQLQPLAKWKREEGYIVEEYYTHGETNSAIRDQLKRRYHLATPTRPAPLFVLIAGDAPETQLWVGRHHVMGLDGHRTDLYYGEYTGDYLPEAMVGRLSAVDTQQMSDIIAKTIAYERYQMADTSHLTRSLLVAGKEETHPAPTATNGQVNYLKSLIIDHDPSHDTICYYNPSSDSLATQILNDLRSSAGLVSYTSHCVADGWRHPLLTSQDIDSLPSNGRYFISINNCCKSNEVLGNCFGEHLLRHPNGGSVGVIGASNETLWLEDYYWSVGSTECTIFPQYEADHPGAYDLMLHTHNESIGKHATTMGQLLMAGNWAVTASGSQYDAFYWEIYSLLGDPSLMPYIGIPTSIQLTIDSVRKGDATVTLHGTPGAHVALTRGDTLYGFGTIDGEGTCSIDCLFPVNDTLLVTATAQYHKPLQQLLIPEEVTGSRVIVKSLTLTTIEGDTATQLLYPDSTILYITLTNIGTIESEEVLLEISEMRDSVLTITPQTFQISPMGTGEETTVSLILRPLYNAESATLSFSTTHGQTTTVLNKTLDIVSPQTEIVQTRLLKGYLPASDIIPGEEYSLEVTLANNGNCDDHTTSVTLTETGDRIEIDSIAAGGEAVVKFNITADSVCDSLHLTIRLENREHTTNIYLTYPCEAGSEAIDPEPYQPTRIKAFPNPATDMVMMTGFSHTTQITIYDSRGLAVATLHAEPGETVEYHTDKLPRGIYCILCIWKDENGNINKETLKTTVVR